MRVGLLSDVHGNFVALKRVLADASAQGVDTHWFLGDVLGYGPRPLDCLDCLQTLPIADGAWLLGNHDLATWLLYKNSDWTIENREIRRLVAGWQSLQVIDNHGLQLNGGLWWVRPGSLGELPNWKVIRPGVCLAHGVVFGEAHDSSNFDHYLRDYWKAQRSFSLVAKLEESKPVRLLIVGHTHVPTFWQADNEGIEHPWHPVSIDFNGDTQPLGDLQRRQVVINPGSVGQPRDGDARAAYAILDLERNVVNFRRVEYDIEQVQKEMRGDGYPGCEYYPDYPEDTLIGRLAVGK